MRYSAKRALFAQICCSALPIWQGPGASRPNRILLNDFILAVTDPAWTTSNSSKVSAS